MTYRDRPWPDGGPGGHMDPYTAPGPQPRSQDMATQALSRALRLPLPHDWATFTREEIEAIQAEARRQGAERERKRIAAKLRDDELSARSLRWSQADLNRWADAIEAGEWSSEEVDDG